MRRQVAALLVVGLVAAVAAVAYRVGHLHGVDAGYWRCASDLGAVG